MKYKGLAAAACAGLLLLSLVRLPTGFSGDAPRYHQHRERPAAQPCAGHETGETLCSHLPLVLIETGGEAIPGVPIEDGDGDWTMTALPPPPTAKRCCGRG